MVAGLLERLGGDAGKRRVGRRAQGVPERQLVGIEEELARHRLSEVAVGLLDEKGVGELALGSQHGEVVLVFAPAPSSSAACV